MMVMKTAHMFSKIGGVALRQMVAIVIISARALQEHIVFQAAVILSTASMMMVAAFLSMGRKN
jgi:hypothetical protein